MIALSAQLVGVNRHALTEQVLRTHAVAADAAASRIRSELSARRAFLRLVVAESRWDISRRELIGERLAEFLQESSALGSVAVSLVDGQNQEILRAQREAAPARIFDLLATVESPEIFVEAAGTYWFAARQPLAGRSGDLALTIVFDTIETTESLHPDELGPEATVWLAEPERVLWGSGSRVEEVPPRLLELASTRYMSGSGRFQSGGQDFLGAFSPVAGTPWFVVSTQTSAVAEKVSRDMRARSGIAVGIAFCLVAALSAGGYRSIVRPLRALIAEQDRLLGQAPSKDGDEISRIKESFKALARHVTNNEALKRVFLGRYQVLEMVGEGAMGSVFLGWDPTLKRPVALKTVKIASKGSQEAPVDLMKEAIIIAQLDHPNIVRVFDVRDAPEASFIAMEFVPGSSLRQLLRAGNPLPIAMTIHVCHAVAAALAAAHASGVQHNDVKPGNVLLREDGRAKITDFGISHAVSSLDAEAEFLYGTPGYLAPETIQGDGRDERADLFALGVMAYECVVGSAPFSGSSVTTVLRSTLQTNVIAPFLIRPETPEELSELIMELLEKDPDRRLATASEAASRFADLAESFPWNGTFASGATASDAAESWVSFIPTEYLDQIRTKPIPGPAPGKNPDPEAT